MQNRGTFMHDYEVNVLAW